MREVIIEEAQAAAMVALGFARRCSDGVLELTDSGEAFLAEFLGKKACELGQHAWKRIGQVEVCLRPGCNTQRLTRKGPS